MAIAVLNDLDNIFAHMPIDETQKKFPIKIINKKRHLKENYKTELIEKTKDILKLTNYIELNWDKLDAKQKESLKSFCYSYIGEKKIDKKIEWLDILKDIKSVFSGIRTLTSGKMSMSDFGDFFVALDKLNNTILSMIEYENPHFKEKLGGMIESAVKGEGKDISYGEFNEWLNGMAAKAGK